MASARKKQDEKNLKILRELVSLPGNKHCFDCNQRGPTYVNMTIGSFVCTKCSGLLRGLTPPLRVKSISMASFTSEEVDFVKSHGNDVCASTWLALYDEHPDFPIPKDEQKFKDFMTDKYERKRYYHDIGLRNGALASPPRPAAPTVTSIASPTAIPSPGIIKSINRNGNMNGNSRVVKDDFVADFGSADIFSANQFNNNVMQGGKGNNSQPSFANFDNNVIFNSATSYPSSYELLMNQLQIMQLHTPPRYPLHNHWNAPSPSQHNGLPPSGITAPTTNGFASVGPKPMFPPTEDRYAALKDLDNALKSQQEPPPQPPQPHIEWGSNGSGYASPSPLYGSPSTSGSMYGSPSQGNFMTAFHQQETNMSNVSNPFSAVNGGTRNPWAVNGNSNMNNTVIANNCFTNNTSTAFSSSPNNGSGFGNGANPFRDNFNTNKFNGSSNGFNGFQNNFFPSSNSSQTFSKPWANPNPFTLGVSPSAANGASNNPFL